MRNAIISGIVVTFATAFSLAVAQAPTPKLPVVQVYKNASCGCCVKWIELLRKEGFTVTASDVTDLEAIKKKHYVTESLASCHTALVGPYVVEGHVPVADIKRLLKERPNVAGIAVPGMPMGSPGMESPNPQPYQVVTFDRNGTIAVFSAYP